jgi:hypothetical protein
MPSPIFVLPANPSTPSSKLGLNKEYYCDRVRQNLCDASSELFINGLAADVMFFRGSLDKLGIYPDIYQIGNIKAS